MHSDQQKICLNWAKEGNCKNGNKCYYSHNNDRFANSNSKSICRNWDQDGQCKFGDKCNFFHNIDRCVIPKQICRNWAQEGHCKFGDSCNFSHNNNNKGYEIKIQIGGGQSIVPKNFGKINNLYRKPNYSEQYSKEKTEKLFHLNEKPKVISQFCKLFRKGNCSKENCLLKHTWTDTDDLNLLNIIDLGNNSNDSDPEIKHVFTIDKNDKSFGFSFQRKIEFYSFTTKIKQSKIFNENEEITCLKYFNDYLILGVNLLDLTFSVIRLLFRDRREINISPAHQDSITDIVLFKEYLFSASFDRKIKLWKWAGESSKFIVAYSHVLESKITKLKYEFLKGKELIFVVCANQAIFVFEIKEEMDKDPFLFFVFELKNYHEKLITNMMLYQVNLQKIYLITSSMDQTIKFYNLVDNNSFKSMDLGIQITCIEIAINNKGKKILVVGFINGNVKLYELSNYQKIGKLIIHKGASITNIVSIKDNINDVFICYLLITDSQGKCSFWCFQQAIHH